jgi:preprotein translocase subunit SecG
MQETILIIYLVVSIALIGIILLQQGKGAEMGASFGAGGANTVFGAAGSGNVLTKTTTILAILFFATALSISYFNGVDEVTGDAVLDETTATEQVQTSLEAELPVGQDALEAEVPSTNEDKVDSEKMTPAIDKAEAEAVKEETAVQEGTAVEEDKEDGKKD